jgi:uncharacterized membrane protein YsdA (DUF1294 family)/cold shock CspA family protein
MKLNGKIQKWNDEKGFGFIKLDSSDEELFFHIKSFRNSNTRPSIGMAVNFELGEDNQGRRKAKYVRVSSDRKSYPAIKAFIVAAIFLGTVGFLSRVGYIPIAIFWLYIAASIWSLLLYRMDKSAAEKGRRRTAEATLHNFSLIGGWPGDLFAQEFLRHKSKKESFRRTFWVTVFLNISALVYLITPYGAWLAHEINKFVG